MVATTELGVRLLGELDLRLGESPLPALESGRAESLLAYLLLHRDAPQPRQRLAFLLWPDSTRGAGAHEPAPRPAQAAPLAARRRPLPRDHAADAALAARRAAAARRRRVRGRAGAARRRRRAALREAVDVYTGDLLEGCYDEWLLEERERLRAAAIWTRSTASRDGWPRPARRRGRSCYAERLCAHDPLREQAYRLLMRLHDARGDRARALRVYHACAAALGARARRRAVARPRARPTRRCCPGDDAAPAERRARAAARRARAERTRLTELWRASERGRAQLVLVSGEPGIGQDAARRGAARLVRAPRRDYRRGALVPAEGALAYGPVVAWLRSEALAPRRVRLDRGRLAELARVLPELPARGPAEPLPESEQRQRLFDALAAALARVGAPLLLVADDVHWADRETLQFLHYLLRSRAGCAAARGGDGAPRGVEQDPLSELLAGLRRARARRPSSSSAAAHRGRRRPCWPSGCRARGRRRASAPVRRDRGQPAVRRRDVARRLDGRAQRWSAAGAGGDRGAARAALRAGRASSSGVAATVGREFTARRARRARRSGRGRRSCARLDELWRRRIIREQGPDAYDFSHDKIREARLRRARPGAPPAHRTCAWRGRSSALHPPTRSR